MPMSRSIAMVSCEITTGQGFKYLAGKSKLLVHLDRQDSLRTGEPIWVRFDRRDPARDPC
jgi:hypothetical protein